MNKQSVFWNNTKEERKIIFEKAIKDYPNCNNPYPLTTWMYKEYNSGVNFAEGFNSEVFDCVYRKSTYQYKFYKSGFNKKQNEL